MGWSSGVLSPGGGGGLADHGGGACLNGWGRGHQNGVEALQGCLRDLPTSHTTHHTSHTTGENISYCKSTCNTHHSHNLLA